MDNLPEQDNGPNPFFADGEIPDNIAQESGMKHRLVFDVRLSEGLGFTEDDLAVNRAGELTEDQLRSFEVSPWFMIAFILLMLAFLLTGDVLETEETTRDQINGLMCWVLPFVIMAIAAFAYGRSQNPSGKVASIIGAVFPHEHSKLKIIVSGQEMELPKITGPIFVEGEHYVIYYVPKSKMIVAAERIDYD